MDMQVLQLYLLLMGIVFLSPIFFVRSAFIKVSIFIYAYPIWIISGLWLGIPATRIVERIGMAYYSEYVDVGFYWALLSYVFFLIPIYKVKDAEFSFGNVPLPYGVSNLLILLLIPVLFIAYPAAMGVGATRFGSFGSLVVCLLALIVSIKTPPNIINYAHWILGGILIFIILRGERVDFILVLLTLYVVNIKSSYISFKILLPMLVLMLIVGSFGGAIRAGDTIEFADLPVIIWYTLINFGTAIDVVHVYLSAIWYYHEYPLNLGPFINLLSSFVPLNPYGGVSSELNLVWVLRDKILNVGGGTFYSVGVITFGWVGAISFGYLYGVILTFLFKLKDYYACFFYAFFIMQFRLQWYGATYFGKVFLVLVFLGLFFLIIKKAGLMKGKGI